MQTTNGMPRRRSAMCLRASLVVTALLASVLMLSASPAGAQPGSCSVANADGGIDVTWDAVPDAIDYVYRLEVPGENNRYRRVDTNTAFIGLAEGAVGTVFVSAIFADGTYSPSVACGSGQANDGSGEQQPTCSVANADGGVDVSWNGVSGAVEYVYRLEVDGQNNRYGRVLGTSIFVPLSDGVVGTFFVSGVKANGSYTAAVPCGSGQANDGTGEMDPTCSAASATGGIEISWTPIDNADRYVYRLEVAGQNNQYGVVSAADDSVVVPLAAGTEGTLFVSAKFDNGSYSNGVACGSAIAGGGGGISAPASCSIVSTPGGADVSWDAVDDAASYIVYRSQYRTDIRAEDSVSGTSTSYTEVPLWFRAATSVAAVDGDGNVSSETACGSLTAGTPNGPACVAVVEGSTATISWDEVPYNTVFHRVNYTIDGATTEQPPVFEDTLVVDLDGGSLDSVEVFAQILSGGPQPTTLSTLTSTCEIENQTGGIAAPANCATTETPGGADVSWDAVDDAASYIVYRSQYRTDVLAEDSVSDTSISFTELPLWFSAATSVAAVAGDGTVSEKTACGSLNAGTPSGPACVAVVDGSTVTISWDAVAYNTLFHSITYTVDGAATEEVPYFDDTLVVNVGDGSLDSVEVFAQILSGGPQPNSLSTLSSTCEIQ